MQEVVVRDCDKDLFIVDKRAAHGKEHVVATPQRLEEMKTKHRVATAKVTLLGSFAADLDASVMVFPRPANPRVFWLLLSLYKVLGVTVARGQASHWLAVQLPKW